MIPFVRNLIEYGRSEQKYFLRLTHLLHMKKGLSYDEDGNILKLDENHKNNKEG